MAEHPEERSWSRRWRYDQSDMLGAVGSFAAQARQGVEMGREPDLIPFEGPFSQVLVSGLGGSAVGGDMLRVVAEIHGSVPVLVNRQYTVPAWVDEKTLAFVVSYSGNTEETLAAFHQLVERGSPVVVITSGGRLAEAGRKLAATGQRAAVVEVPGGLPPRAATGYLFFPMLEICRRLGLLAIEEAEVVEAIERVAALAARLAPSDEENEAQRLARRLAAGPILVYGLETLGEVAAYRWQTQLNENAKRLAHSHVFSELNHNEVVGWEEEPLPPGERQVVLLLHQGAHPRNRLRVDITSPQWQGRARVHRIEAGEGSPLGQMLELVYWGDWVSTYHALWRKVDPSRIQSIVTLKEALSQPEE